MSLPPFQSDWGIFNLFCYLLVLLCGQLFLAIAWQTWLEFSPRDKEVEIKSAINGVSSDYYCSAELSAHKIQFPCWKIRAHVLKLTQEFTVILFYGVPIFFFRVSNLIIVHWPIFYLIILFSFLFFFRKVETVFFFKIR